MQFESMRPATGRVYLRQGKRGSVWYARLALPDGFETRRKLGPHWAEKTAPPPGYLTKKLAEAELRKILVEADRGEVTGFKGRVTFSDACDEFLRFIEQERRRRSSTLDDYRSAINAHLRPAFGNLPIGKITARGIEQWRSPLVPKYSPRQLNKIVTIMHGVMERARRVHGLPANVVADVERLPERYSGDLDVYSPEEVWRLVNAAEDEQDGAIYLTAAFTGMRLGELRALRWGDVLFKEQAIRVRGSYTHGSLNAPKSGKVRSVPMVEDVAAMLSKLRQRERWIEDGDLVFPGDAGGHFCDSALRRRFNEAVKRAGLRRLRFHDLRHCFGSLAIKRAEITAVKEWMGHSSVRVTERYLHYRNRADEAAILSAAFKVEKPDLRAA